MKSLVKKSLIIAVWLALWQLVSFAVGNDILLAGPLEVVQRLLANVQTPAFWGSIAFSAARIVAGFALAFLLALLLGTIAWRLSLFREFLAPAVTFIKSVPVVCVIVLLLVWVGSAWVSLIAVALMVFPPVYFSYLEGLMNADKQLAGMLRVFHVSRWQRIRVHYWPSVQPYLVSAARAVVGVSWKSGVAAEVIGIPNGSMGAGIYLAKIGLDTAGLFAWTVVIVGLGALCEKAFLAFLAALASRGAQLPTRYVPSCFGHARAEGEEVRLASLNCAYDGKTVLQDVSLTFAAGQRYCIMAPSGSGKTTLLAAIAGQVAPAAGTVSAPSHVAAVFQEDRLLPQLSAWDNVRLVCSLSAADAQLLKFDLDESLGADSAAICPDECSGGMRRKVALARALAAGGQCLLLDEPFAGLDHASRTDMVALINRYANHRTVIVATHDRADVEYLQAQLVRL